MSEYMHGGTYLLNPEVPPMRPINGRILATSLASLGLVASAIGQQPPNELPPTPKTETVVDRGYRPRPGDRAEVIPGTLIGTEFQVDLWDYLRSSAARDNVGTQQLIDSGSAKKLTAGTKVLVIQTVNTETYRPQTTSLTGFADGLQRGALSSPRDPEDVPAAEVRILDGPLKDQALWVTLDGIGRRKEQVVPPPRVVRKAPEKPKPVSAEDRAESLLRMGRGLEQAGNAAAAVGYYREIVEKHPGQPAAKEAGERLRALRPE